MALRNTRFCSSAVNNNLHLTNWNRKQGCKCQHKAIVDWCGCSPNDFLPEDKEKLSKTARRDDIFFARKFEPIISQESVDFLDGWISRGDPDADFGDVPGWKSYWQNVYHHLDRSPAPRSEVVSLGMILAQLTLDTSQVLPKGSRLKELREITIYKKEDVFRGALIRFVVDDIGIELESHLEIRPTRGMIWNPREVAVSIGTDHDPKEVLFRNFFSAIGPQSDPMLLYESDEGGAVEFDVIWFDPVGDIAAVDHIAIANGTDRVEETVKPSLPKPLRPGRWMVTIVNSEDNDIVLIIPLLVIPNVQNSSENAGPVGGDQPVAKDSALHELFNGGDRMALRALAKANAAKTGADLMEWGVELAEGFYAVVRDCFVSNIGSERFNIPLCETESWSSLSRDKKSEIAEIDANTGNLK